MTCRLKLRCLYARVVVVSEHIAYAGMAARGRILYTRHWIDKQQKKKGSKNLPIDNMTLYLIQSHTTPSLNLHYIWYTVFDPIELFSTYLILNPV